MVGKRLVAVLVVCGVVFGLSGCGRVGKMSEDEAMSLFKSELSSPPEGEPNQILTASSDVCEVVREAVKDDHTMKLDDDTLLEYVRAKYGAEQSDALVFSDVSTGTDLVILGQDAKKYVYISRQWLCPDTLPKNKYLFYSGSADSARYMRDSVMSHRPYTMFLNQGHGASKI